MQAKHNVDIQIIPADISTESGIELVKTASAKYKIGLLVLAAGSEVNGAFEKNSIGKEIAVINLNVLSMLRLTHYFVNKMVPAGKGDVLLLASLSGHMPNPYLANYAGTKAYVLNFGASLYGELKPKGIDVTVLSPGLTKTPMTKNNDVNWSKTHMTPMNPDAVAAVGVNALGKRLIAIPSAKNKMMALMAKLMPLQMQSKMNENMLRKAIDNNKV